MSLRSPRMQSDAVFCESRVRLRLEEDVICEHIGVNHTGKVAEYRQQNVQPELSKTDLLINSTDCARSKNFTTSVDTFFE
jgi:hypothetical protein